MIVPRLAALAAAFLFLATGTALACADFARAPSSRWTLRAEGAAQWLVTPCGDRFFSLGVNVLAGQVPEKEVPGRTRYDWRRYYPSLADWGGATRQRLADWGFNTAGAWSLPAGITGLPSIPNLELGRLSRFHWFDPFDPDAATRMREAAARLVGPYRGSPYRIGYFSDNEVGWWGGALFYFYSAKPASSYTKRRWVETLRDQYRDDWERFVADFVPPDGVTSWDGLLAAEHHTRLRPGGDGIRAVRRWTATVAERYYALAAEAIRAADPDALLFGDRLPIYYDPVALRAMARHVDALAVNYNVDSADGWIARYFFDGLRQLSGGKPVLISEWFFAANENNSGNRNTGHLMTVETQEERARGAAAATVAFAAVPEIIGMHWFQWPDHPAGGRADGEDYNFGLVDIENRPYPELISALAEANRVALHRHETARPPVPRKGGIVIPRATIETGDHSLRDWPKPAALLPPLAPAAGEVAFGEAYLAWDERGLALATIGQDYYDVDLLAYDGEFPLGEAYRIELGVDAGAGPRRFTLFFIPPRTKVKDHPPMAALLCAGAPRSIAECEKVPGAETVYFGADQPRITAEAMLPWAALGIAAGPPPGETIRVEVAGTAWHRSRWMSLSGMPPEEGMARPERWATARLGNGKPGS